MIIRTFFDKNNTIIRNDYINTGRNPVSELFYGGAAGENRYSRFLFHFDEARLRDLYSGGTFIDLSKLKHTLKLTNTSTFDEGLLNGSYQSKDRAASFDLVVFPIAQNWDEGVGYDYNSCVLLIGNTANSTIPSNWIYAQTGIYWDNGGGSYSASPTVIGTQHFNAGNENMEVDITSYVNNIITGGTNYGLGIAYARSFEVTETRNLQYVGFFTRHTQTFYEPYIETNYINHIKDDRNNFFLDKQNKLYLYVNLAGNPTNLDEMPLVDIFDQNGDPYTSYTSSDIAHVTKGIYSIDLMVPNSQVSSGYLFNDIWSNIKINGVTRPEISLKFEVMDSAGYFNIGDTDELPRKVAVSIAGLQSQERIKRGDIRKVIVSTRIPYTVEQSQSVTNLKYRLYVREGRNEVTVIDFDDIEMATNYNYFLLDTESLIPNTYYLDIKVESNLEVNTLKNVINFDIVSDSNFRISQ